MTSHTVIFKPFQPIQSANIMIYLKVNLKPYSTEANFTLLLHLNIMGLHEIKKWQTNAKY